MAKRKIFRPPPLAVVAWLALASPFIGLIVAESLSDRTYRAKAYLEPREVQIVTSPAPGIVHRLYHQVGDKVEKGDVLLDLRRDHQGDEHDIMQVVAPIGGTIIESAVLPGERPSTSSPLFSISDLSTLHAVVRVDSEDVHLIKTGMPVRFYSENHRNRLVDGIVHKVVPQTRKYNKHWEYYPALVVMDNKNEELLPGQPLRARIVLEENSLRKAIGFP